MFRATALFVAFALLSSLFNLCKYFWDIKISLDDPCKLVACGVAFFYDNRQTFSAVYVILQYYIYTALQFSIIKGSCLLIDLSTMLVSSS